CWHSTLVHAFPWPEPSPKDENSTFHLSLPRTLTEDNLQLFLIKVKCESTVQVLKSVPCILPWARDDKCSDGQVFIPATPSGGFDLAAGSPCQEFQRSVWKSRVWSLGPQGAKMMLDAALKSRPAHSLLMFALLNFCGMCLFLPHHQGALISLLGHHAKNFRGVSGKAGSGLWSQPSNKRSQTHAWLSRELK
uniref:Uncharacterized protein n=1 Tax=Ficedula albicollis TaxID=59894 RepID=A0A803V534_FICAL